MKTIDILRLSLNSLSHRGLRSWLTILGIIIGVAAVVAMLSIGAGMTQTVEAQLSGFGADILNVMPGYTEAERKGSFVGGKGDESDDVDSPTLTNTDIHTISNVDGVIAVNGIIQGSGDISYLSESIYLGFTGVDPVAFNEITTLEVEYGRFLNTGDNDGILIGSAIANDLFSRSLTINTGMRINDQTFRIIGILSPSGAEDYSIYMTHAAAREIVDTIGSNEYSSIQVKIVDTDLVEEITGDIENSLFSSRMVTEETRDFTIYSLTSYIETIESTVETLSFFFIGIAAISLIVGAIGIANTMFMSVLERIRLIGIFKSLGTKNYEIMGLFITESAIIGLMGGVLGVFLGLIMVGFISNSNINFTGTVSKGGGAASSIPIVVTPELIIFSLIFATIIGVISGLIPARNAAKLQVVEAMRSE